MSDSSAPDLDPDLRSRLQELLDPSSLVLDPDLLVRYETDALGTFRGAPLAVLRPGSREELRTCVRTLYEAGVPMVPRGAGSGLAAAAVPDEAVVVSTERMDRILEIDPLERTATTEPGVITDEISEAAAEHGLHYLPDPASSAFCSIGGNVAMNAGGPHCLRDGVTSDHVLELEVITPDGTSLTLGRGDDGGLDLAGLFIGSEGTMGFVARVTVRLVPRPEAVETVLATFDDLEAAGRAVSDILAAGLVPAAMELIDQAAIRAVEDTPHGAGLPTDVAAALLVECDGLPGETDGQLMAVAEGLEGAGPREVMAAADDAQRARLWRARKEAYRALEAVAPNIFIQDAAVPRTELPRILPRIREIAEAHDLPVVNFFHAGDGNLHPNLPFDGGDPEETARVRAASTEIMELCVDAGGTITGEHGVGLDKKQYMPLIFGETELRLQRALKRAFDPAGLANPDKLFPDPADPAADHEAADPTAAASPAPKAGDGRA